MNKNRILCLILTLMMLISIAVPTHIFAEENEEQTESDPVEVYEEVQEEPPAAEEPAAPEEDAPAAEEPAAPEEGAPAAEEPAVPEEDAAAAPEEAKPESESSEEPVEDKTEIVESETKAAENDAAVSESQEEITSGEEVTEEQFSQGYVRIAVPAYVYENEYWQNEIGILPADSVVFAVVSTYADTMNESWLHISFDTAAAREADEDFVTGYIQFKDVTVLSEEEAELFVASLDPFTRSNENIFIPFVSSFQAIEAIETITEEVEDQKVFLTTPDVEIVSNPENATAAADTNATFSVTATNADSYVWQLSQNNGESWTNCGKLYTGRLTDTLTVKA
ncbi:MAG: hypothetical protein IJI61_08220, partial [Oscillospiraceae bacterium]|nr:hypothetical protein [Oscillospiraceae bacterium]